MDVALGGFVNLNNPVLSNNLGRFSLTVCLTILTVYTLYMYVTFMKSIAIEDKIIMMKELQAYSASGELKNLEEFKKQKEETDQLKKKKVTLRKI